MELLWEVDCVVSITKIVSDLGGSIGYCDEVKPAQFLVLRVRVTHLRFCVNHY